MKPTWKIYYGDSSTFDNTQGTPFEAPATDVQVIIFADQDNGRLAIHNWDWYYYQEGLGWRGSDTWGLLDRFMYVGNITAVKQARTIENAVFAEIINKALVDKDFPPKTTGIQVIEKPQTDQITGVRKEF